MPVLLSKADNTSVSRDEPCSGDEEKFPDRKDEDSQYLVRDVVGTKEGNPYRDVVAAEGHTHTEGGESASPIFFANGRVSGSPRVIGKGKRSKAKDTGPTKRYCSQQRSDAHRDDDKRRDAERLGDAETAKPRSIAERQLRGEREEIVDHGTDERQ